MRLRGHGAPGKRLRGGMIPCAPVLHPAQHPMSIALTAAQNRFLRGQAHELKAMLQVGGKGVTDAVVAVPRTGAAIDRASFASGGAMR